MQALSLASLTWRRSYQCNRVDLCHFANKLSAAAAQGACALASASHLAVWRSWGLINFSVHLSVLFRRPVLRHWRLQAPSRTLAVLESQYVLQRAHEDSLRAVKLGKLCPFCGGWIGEQIEPLLISSRQAWQQGWRSASRSSRCVRVHGYDASSVPAQPQVTCDPPFELLHGEAAPSILREPRSSVPVRSRAAPGLDKSPPLQDLLLQRPWLDLAAKRRRLTRIAGRRRAAHIRPGPPAPLRRLEMHSPVCALCSAVRCQAQDLHAWPLVGRRQGGAVLQNR